MSSEYTPTPWAWKMKSGRPRIYASEYREIADVVVRWGPEVERGRANAEHITHCVNTYPHLVEALRRIADTAEMCGDRNGTTFTLKPAWVAGVANDALESAKEIK